MKLPLICTTVLLLSSCSLFETTPEAVIKGQRAVYQSVLVVEATTNAILDQYMKDCKRLITYHTSYVFQLRLQEIESWEQNDWRDKAQYKQEAEDKRDAEIAKAFKSLEERAAKLRAVAKRNHSLALRLAASVYNYLSTSPIEIDNMEFWIEKLDRISKEQDEVK